MQSFFVLQALPISFVVVSCLVLVLAGDVLTPRADGDVLTPTSRGDVLTLTNCARFLPGTAKNILITDKHKIQQVK